MFADFPVGCAYRDWQKQVLSFLEGEYKQKLKKYYFGAIFFTQTVALSAVKSTIQLS